MSERVVVTGLQRVRPGAKVDPKPAKVTPPGPATAKPAVTFSWPGAEAPKSAAGAR